MLKNIQLCSERRKMSSQTWFKWSSTTWSKSIPKSHNHGCAHQKDTTKIWKTMKTLKPPDSVWEPLTDWFTQLVSKKSWVFFLKLSNHYFNNQTGDINTLQLWLCHKSVNILMNQKRSHQSCKWSLDSWETQTQCSDILHAMLLVKSLMICNQNSKKFMEIPFYLNWSTYLTIKSQESFLTQLLLWPTFCKEWNGNKSKVASHNWLLCYLNISAKESPSLKKAVWVLSHQSLKSPRKIMLLTSKIPSDWCSISSKTKNTKANNTNNSKVNQSKLWLSLLAPSVDKCSNQSPKDWLIWWLTCNNLNSNKLTHKRLTFWPDGKDYAWFMENNLVPIWTESCPHCSP